MKRSIPQEKNYLIEEDQFDDRRFVWRKNIDSPKEGLYGKRKNDLLRDDLSSKRMPIR